MAAKVSLVNIGKDLWSYLCRQIPPPVALSNYTSEGQLSDVLKSGNLDADIIVLGHHIDDPLKVANWVKAVNPFTKIFVLRRPSDYEIMRRDFEASPALGEGLFLCSTADIKRLPAALASIPARSANDTNIEAPATPPSEDKIPVLHKKAILTQTEDIDVVDDLLENAHVGFILLDKNLTITHVNSFACDLLEIDQKDSLALPADVIFRNEEPDTIKRLIEDLKEGEEKSSGLITLRNKDETETLFIRCAVSLNDIKNPDLGYSLLLQNQTNLIRIESELLEEQTRNKLTLELLQEGVITTDHNFEIVHMNPVAESLTGWPTYEAKGHKLDEIVRLIDADKRERMTVPVEFCMEESRTMKISESLHLISNDNNEHAIEITIAPNSPSDSKRTGCDYYH